jgi:hypothetical protein
MNRTKFINSLLSKQDTKNYLEIGVRNGENFFSIESNNKVGVDPSYFFSKRFHLKSLLKSYNWNYKMYQKTSDSFFQTEADIIYNRDKIDVAFIDGLHTYEQSLSDARNCLRYLNNNGYIIFHDCNPLTAEAANPQIPQRAINWNGDVWKAIHHLRKYENHFHCFTLDFDEGIGILKVKDTNYFELLDKLVSDPQIQNLTFNDLESNRQFLIGLQNFESGKNY